MVWRFKDSRECGGLEHGYMFPRQPRSGFLHWTLSLRISALIMLSSCEHASVQHKVDNPDGDRFGLKVIVELEVMDSMSDDLKHAKVFSNGLVQLLDTRGSPSAKSFQIKDPMRILHGLEKLSFHELEMKMAERKIEAISQRQGHVFAVSDEQTVIVRVNLPYRNKTVSWYALDSYVQEFPMVEELKILKDCVSFIKRELSLDW